MEFTRSLIPGRLVQRYKRFLADVELDDGRSVTAHCANPGAMLGLNAPGERVWLEPNDDPKRKLKFAWRLVELANGHWAGIDTGVPNRVVGEALREGRIAELADYSSVRAEVRYAERSRVDFLLSTDGAPDLYLEVKNVHLMRTAGLAEFPDSVTARGARHLDDLAAEVARGNRAMMLYCVQRTDCDALDFAGDIDPNYADAVSRARRGGVGMIAYGCRISPERITLDRPIRIAG